MRSAALLLLLSGCADMSDRPRLPRLQSASSPIVRAQNAAVAQLTLIACLRTPGDARSLTEAIRALAAEGVLVDARDAGRAMLTLNLCNNAAPPAARG